MPAAKDYTNDFAAFARDMAGLEVTPHQKRVAAQLDRRLIIHPGGPNFGKRAMLDFVEKAARDAGMTVVRVEPGHGR